MNHESPAALTGLWSEPIRDASERARLLYHAMTVAERVAQLGSCWVGNDVISGNVGPMQDVFRAGAIGFEEQRKNGLGHLTRPFGTKPIEVNEGVQQLVEYQLKVMASNRFGIPAIAHEECLTGFTAWGATVYPAAIAWGATWNPELIEEMAFAIGSDMRAVGIHQGLSPLLDVVRDYRWGRVEETIGEDPMLVATLGTAYVKGLQRGGVIATLKHFAGYSASRGARNHAPVSMGRREFEEVMLMPFEMAVRYGNVRAVMNSYADVDGLPAGADRDLLTHTLRDRWGFSGTVVSDYWSIAFLKTMHRLCETYDDAGLLALDAGIDVELPDSLAYGHALVERIERGEVPESIIEASVLRVLRQKAELGILDEGWQPDRDLGDKTERVDDYINTKTRFDLNSEGNDALAQRVAEQSVVLLTNNEGALPLDPKTKIRIGLLGPTADDALAFMGCYSFPNHVLPHHSGTALGVESPSLYEAMRSEFPNAHFVHAAGVPISAHTNEGISAAVELARSCDLVVLAVGDRAGLFGHGTSGEGTDTSTLQLPGLQHELVNAVLAANANTVLVSISGRPYALADFHGTPVAVVQAFMPGQRGGGAIAGVLSGRVNPSGKLPVQIPRLHGPQPSTYLQAPLGHYSEGVSNLDPRPAFSFGFGLSYSSFVFSEMAIDSAEISNNGTMIVSLRVHNNSERDGTEVVQLYLTDHVAQTVRPLVKLLAYKRVDLAANETKKLLFSVHADTTSFVGKAYSRIVEPGRFTITAGNSVNNQPLRVDFSIVGDVRIVGNDWKMVVESTVDT
jgi:beta-glucosidase-like glycosyl hydrolase